MRTSKAEKYRVTTGFFKTEEGQLYGLFFVPAKLSSPPLKVMVAPIDKGDWQHVSVSLSNRCPTWEEMSLVKNLFWEEEEVVIQIHPKKSENVSNHPYCLHLWRYVKENLPMPPSIMVGIKELGSLI
jgi:hypothetical protein